MSEAGSVSIPDEAVVKALEEIVREATAQNSILQPGAAFALGVLGELCDVQPGDDVLKVASLLRDAFTRGLDDLAARIDELRQVADQIDRIKYTSGDEVSVTISQAVARDIAQQVRDKAAELEAQR